MIPMIRLQICRERTAEWFSANISHMCCVELAGLSSAGKGLLHTGIPQARGAEFYPFGFRFPSLCIAATFEAYVFPCGHCLLFVSGFGVLLLLGGLINLDTLGKWSSASYPFCYAFIGA